METVIGFAAGEGRSEKLEVCLAREGGETTLRLRVLSWGSGIGWFPQKTLSLEAEAIDPLQSLLKQAKAIIQSNPQKRRPSKGRLLSFPARAQEGLKPRPQKALEGR